MIADYDDGRTKVIENFGVCVIRFTMKRSAATSVFVLGRIREELKLPFV